MLENRKLSKAGKYTYRLFKSDSDESTLAQIELFQKHYSRSVSIEDFGEVKEESLKKFENICDDLAYLDLKLKINDKFILVKEITHIKMDDDKKIISNKKYHKRMTNTTKQWNNEQLNHLWNGSAETVAKIVNRTASEVEKERKIYIKNHPGFTYPKECRKIRKGYIKNGYWEKNKNILWGHSSEEVQKLTNKSAGAIYQARMAFLQTHKGFIIPKSSCFEISKAHVKDKYQFSYEEIPQIKEEISVLSKIEEKTEEKPEQITNLDKIVQMLNKLDVKPKKIVLGDITLEF